MKRIMPIILVCILLILFLWNCGREQYVLSQPADVINSIDIVSVANDTILVKGFYDAIESVCVIEQEYWDDFLADFHAIPSKRYLNDPAESVTGNAIRITYRDGSFELIGQKAVFSSKPNKDWEYLSFHFDNESFHSLIKEWSKE